MWYGIKNYLNFFIFTSNYHRFWSKNRPYFTYFNSHRGHRRRRFNYIQSLPLSNEEGSERSQRILHSISDIGYSVSWILVISVFGLTFLFWEGTGGIIRIIIRKTNRNISSKRCCLPYCDRNKYYGRNTRFC